ncbi:hypothetical protein [Seleniivibrio sp.]|uniref:hypothetical protein n=1 Tax=Seleniivibrio sp. TaxID=2898801 RepID=UPI0025E57A4A|nr:hypothetical protein [Seleniivibrio sp.]MCD8554415.1 hypothetical protein [Seleniivibrio sp.]
MIQNEIDELDEQTDSSLARKIESEPGYKTVLYGILRFCGTPRRLSEVEQEIKALLSGRSCFHSPQVLMNILIENGGLTVTDEGEGNILLQTTEEGREIASASCPATLVDELFKRDSAYKDIYLSILISCSEPKTLDEIEDILVGNEVMASENILASYFISELEEAGVLRWDVKWKTAQDGLAAVQAYSS